MNNPENLATYGTQDEKKNTQKNHNTLCVAHHYMQINTNNVNK